MLEEINPSIIDEIDKDVKRLQTIADRFSKIGSAPDLEILNVVEETKKSFDYLQSRSSKLIDFEFESNTDIVNLLLNPTLHSWTIENLIKNAIDAIKGKGRIKVTIKNEANKFVQELYLLSILLRGEEVKQIIGGKRLIEKAVEVFLNSDYVCDNIIYA